MKIKERRHELQELETDPTLLEFEQTLGEFDAFDLLGISRSEEIHSKVLAWLLDPGGSHSMGDSFLFKFLRETKAATTEEIESIDWTKSNVRREWPNLVDGRSGFLDILVPNNDALYLCAIENKIFSGEHSHQLTRYRKALEMGFDKFRRSHLFLTPNGERPHSAEERRCWTSVGYGTVLKLINDLIDHGVGGVNNEIAAFLKQYATTLRRVIVPNTELKQMANRLYFKHKSVIRFIWDHREAHLAELQRICREAIHVHGSWELHGERDNGKLLAFGNRCWREFDVFKTATNLPETDLADLLLIDFDFRNEGEVRLLLTIMPGEREDVRKSLFEKTQGRHPAIFNHRADPRGGSYREDWIRLYRSEPILSEFNLVNQDSASWNETISSWFSQFATEEFPRMNLILLESLQEIEAELGSRQASPGEA